MNEAMAVATALAVSLVLWVAAWRAGRAAVNRAFRLTWCAAVAAGVWTAGPTWVARALADAMAGFAVYDAGLGVVHCRRAPSARRAAIVVGVAVLEACNASAIQWRYAGCLALALVAPLPPAVRVVAVGLLWWWTTDVLLRAVFGVFLAFCVPQAFAYYDR